MAELHEVDAWLAALLSQLEPAARKKMLREVARDVRRIQQANITAQRSPDGTAWEPRRVSARTKQGRIKRKMFTKLKTAKYLKTTSGENEAEIGFNGRTQQIARVHHYGLREQRGRLRTEVKYKMRPLLGINSEVEYTIESILLRWLENNKAKN